MSRLPRYARKKGANRHMIAATADSQARRWEYIGDLLNASEGEVSDELQEELQRLEQDTEECLSVLVYILRCNKRETEALDREVEFFKGKLARKKAQEEYFRTKTLKLMQAAALKGFKTTLGSVSVSNPSGNKISIPDVMQVPEHFRSSEVVWKTNTAMIGVAIQAGADIPGVIVEPRQPYLSVRL
jgi:hypothetical protein